MVTRRKKYADSTHATTLCTRSCSRTISSRDKKKVTVGRTKPMSALKLSTILCIFLLSVFTTPVQSYLPTPSLNPLQYLTVPAIGSYLLDNVQSTVWGLLLPVDQQDAVAIFISEGASGFLGGIAAKGIARIDGNRNNRDTSLASGELSGAYFGTAAAIRSLAQLAGLSSFFVNLLAVIFASALSEFVKTRRRNIRPLQTRVGRGPTMYDLMKFKNPSMLDLMKFAKNEKIELTPRMKMMGQLTTVEVYADLVKYFVVYVALPRGTVQRLEDAVAIGAITGIVSQLVRESKDRELSDEIRNMLKLEKEEKRRKAFGGTGGRIPLSRKVLTRDMFNQREAKIRQLAQTGDIEDGNQPSQLANDVRKSPQRKTVGKLMKFRDMPLEDKVKTLIQQPMNSVMETDEGDGKAPMTMRPDYPIIRFLRSSFECATQLVTYEAAKQYVMEVSPYFQQGFQNIELENILVLQSYF